MFTCYLSLPWTATFIQNRDRVLLNHISWQTYQFLVNRLDIYADLGVPEVWRYDGQTLTMYCLENKQYQNCSNHIAFPLLTLSDIERFLDLKKTTKENALICSFREWIREHLANNT